MQVYVIAKFSSLYFPDSAYFVKTMQLLRDSTAVHSFLGTLFEEENLIIFDLQIVAIERLMEMKRKRRNIHLI